MASPNLSQEVTTTLKKQSTMLADNVSKHNALLRKLKKRGNIKIVDGGRTLAEPLRYQETSTFKYFSGYEYLDLTPTDIISDAEYDWKNAAVTITLAGDEMRKNSGTSQLFDILEAKIENANDTMANNISIGIYSLGTGSSGKQIGGLQLLVADTPTSGTVGGIARSAWTFWRNQTKTNTSAGTIITDMKNLWVATTRGTDQPDLIVADDIYWGRYWDKLQTYQRFTSDNSRDAGPQSISFMGVDVFFDTSGGCTASHMYMLNTKYLYFKVHKDANFSPLDAREPVNQDALVKHIIFMGNLTMSNAARQGVLI